MNSRINAEKGQRGLDAQRFTCVYITAAETRGSGRKLIYKTGEKSERTELRSGKNDD